MSNRYNRFSFAFVNCYLGGIPELSKNQEEKFLLNKTVFYPFISFINTSLIYNSL